MIPVQTSTLTRSQRYALGKVAMHTLEGKQTTATHYPKYTAAFDHLKTEGLIELTPAGCYVLTPAGAQEIQSWIPSSRPVSHSALQDYIREYNNASLYGGGS
jgi:hypothetical protein